MQKFIQHEMLPRADHDEQARQDFVASLRGHLSGRVMPGAYRVYQSRVEPAFKALHGRIPADQEEVRQVMTKDSYYQFWSAMQRRSQEMLWESVIDPTERQLPELIGRAGKLSNRKLAKGQRGSLRLDPGLKVPRYHTAADIHLQPGGYHTDFTADDVAAGVVYDQGINLYMGGALGPENNLTGDTLLAYIQEKYPDFKPQRILDVGCAIGNATLVWSRAFPAAEVHGIDVGAPVLRYAHARAQAFGVPVHFSQQNAEHTDFDAGSFDLVISHIVLHETSKSALVRILRECHRLLRPGGLMLHLEIPRGKTVIEKFMHNWESYNNNETFCRYMTDIDLKAEAIKGGFAEANTRTDEFIPRLDVAQMNYTEHFFLEDPRGNTLMKDPARQHAMLPTLVHDERARQDFVATLRRHLTARIVPGNAQVYAARVAPRLRRELGREPADRHEVRDAMERDSYYQFWSAMQRRSQELLWESVVDPTERDAAAMQSRARTLCEPGRRGSDRRAGSLTLDPALTVPRYHTAVDIHLQPGGYHTDFAPDDLSAGAIYDRGIQIYSAGSTGPLNDSMGRMLVDFLREHAPDATPARILDMGCAIGNSTLPWADAFPAARVDAIDVAAPQLRYAHARARALRKAVHFSQQNAERTNFPDASFDLVVSHIMLHETSRSALRNILAECRRLLRPGGWMLHLEIPRGKTVLEQFQMNWESYNNNETFGSFMTDIDLAEQAVVAGFESGRARCVDYAMHRPQEQRLYSDYFLWRILVARR